MMYVIIENDKIVGKVKVNASITLAENEMEVTEEIYEQLTRLPADLAIDEDGNMTVTPAPAPVPDPEPQPAPEPTLAELREQQIAQAEAITAIFERLEGGV